VYLASVQTREAESKKTVNPSATVDRVPLFTFIFGRRLASNEQKGRKIGVLTGLAALGLDGLSSSAYGPEAALTILLPLGVAGLHFITPITLTILVLLAMLYFSYRQTIAAYPVNGGSYTVAKDNLGTWASLLAAAALMIDYVLTVAVGISAGVGALISVAPKLHAFTLTFCLVVLAMITLANLRGTAEAGITFAVPTYIFIASMGVVLVLGMVKTISSGGHPSPVAPPPPIAGAVASVSAWLLLRSFASGCTAMTGVEAVSNGVSAFKDPTVRNAHRTLTLIVLILALLLAGIAYLAHAYQVGAMDQEKAGYQSVLSQLTGAVVGRGWFYKLTLSSVLAVLCLSANTSFVDFPRLCRLIAKDDFLPRSFAAIDRRLVYSVGVLFLAACAGLLLIAFKGITDRLIPLYAVGAFLAFTLSQSGMVVHWRKQIRAAANSGQNKQPKPRGAAAQAHLKIWINGIGTAGTAAALVIILFAKFMEGAWVTILTIPIMLTVFWRVHRHYLSIEKQVECNDPLEVKRTEAPVVVVPMRRFDKPTAKSLRLAMHLSPDVLALHLSNLEGDAAKDEAAKIRKSWAAKVEAPAHSAGVPVPRLILVQTPYREFITPLLEQIDKIEAQYTGRSITVIIPELVEKRWWNALLHSRRAARLRSALWARQDVRVVVIELPWFVQ
jgi:amino acid transporter